MFDRLRQRIRTLVDGPAPPGLLPGQDAMGGAWHSGEARLTLAPGDGSLQILADFAAEPALVLPGRLAGDVSIRRGLPVEGASLRDAAVSLRLVFTLEVAGRAVPVGITAELARVEHAPGVRMRARRRRLSPTSQAFDVAYGDGETETACYRVVLDADVRPLCFHEVAHQVSVFQGIPSLSQMVAFLRATLHYRRTTMRSLASMARGSDQPHVKAVVEKMGHDLSPSMSFACPELAALQAALQAHGVPANPNTVASLCLLVDIYLERIGFAHLERLCEEGVRFTFSPAALVCGAAFFGMEYHPCGEGPHDPCAVEADREAIERAGPFLRQAVHRRTVLTILADLAADSGSPRSQERVARLQEAVPADQEFRKDEYAALQSYLEHHGRKVQALTLLAVAIYVDFEAGILDLADIDRISRGEGLGPASLYSLLAIARTFDSPLRAFCLPEPVPETGWRDLARLASLASGGMLVGFTHPGGAVGVEHVREPADLEGCRQRGLVPTGDLLADFPMVHHVMVEDADRMRKAGHTVVARFVSHDANVQWRPLATACRPLAGALGRLLRGPYNFVEHYEVYHFNHSIIAWRIPADAAALVDRRDVVAVYRDAREAEQYVVLDHVQSAEEVRTPPQMHWTWDAAVLGFPGRDAFPPSLSEAPHERLVGARTHASDAVQRLDRVSRTLRSHLEKPRRLQRIAMDEAADPAAACLRRTLESGAFRALLSDLVDATGREHLLALLASPGCRATVLVDDALHEALEAGALGDVGALAVVHALGRALPPASGVAVSLDRRGFLDLLVDRLFDHAGSEDPETRRWALLCLGTSPFAHASERRHAVSHVLCRQFDGPDPVLAEAAGSALAALALRRLVAVPKLAFVRPGPPPAGGAPRRHRVPVSPSETRLREIAAEVGSAFSLGTERHRLVMTLLALVLEVSL